MPRGKEIAKFDKMFEMNLRYFEGSVTFVQKVKFTKPEYAIDGYLEYGACNDESCLPPQEVGIKQSGKSPAFVVPTQPMQDKKDAGADPAVAVAQAKAKADSLAAVALQGGADSVARGDSATIAASLSSTDTESWWKPVVDELKSFGGTNDVMGHSLWYLFLMGIIGGLLALVMPCIWPIIPMTISFFLKRSKDDKKKGIRDAIIYGVSIVVIYLGVGLLVTAVFGPSKLNELSTSAVFNVFLFLLLVVFAFSFFGWFEIKLPDSWSNSVDSKASNTTGMLSIFLMAFTLVLVSFSCTAPIVGLLLVETVTSGNWIAPTVVEERTEVRVLDEYHQGGARIC